MRRISTVLVTVLAVVAVVFLLLHVSGAVGLRNHPERDALMARLRVKADSALTYCRNNGLSEKYCFLIDFGIHSGKNRFFIWDFEQDTVVRAGLCAHGHGGNSTPDRPAYSNVEGSFCSSPGRYKTGIPSHSRWGIHIHYKLHGLEPTNSNAFKRIVVLHSYQYVPDAEIYPFYLPLGYSAGCPVVSNGMMRAADRLLKHSDRPFLLWIFDETSDL
ncbi:MAG: murein L,D-transpeptidase catalytic domain family protein [Tannerella sp.]|jgi:hypothetical protein|nr:murein L,D-transpeptidase catalytic domain family protein [Tannerella sp.]